MQIFFCFFLFFSTLNTQFLNQTSAIASKNIKISRFFPCKLHFFGYNTVSKGEVYEKKEKIAEKCKKNALHGSI